ncbi:transposase [Micrococcales bacterium 31B]|nr:transposase [Micrococcales bacterium 31B]
MLITFLTATLHATGTHITTTGPRAHKITLDQQVHLAVMALRTNLIQQVLADLYHVSQPTVSRIIHRITPLISATLRHLIPTVDDLDTRNPLIIDGTLLPCWSWSNAPGVYSGKHRTTGVNVQVACDIHGRLLWVSDPLPGSTHDTKAIREHGLLDLVDTSQVIADRGYIGLGIITPLIPAEKRFARDNHQHHDHRNPRHHLLPTNHANE